MTGPGPARQALARHGLAQHGLARRGLLAAAAALAAGRPARAGSARPIDLIVGAAAGTAPDRAARAFAPFLERHLRASRMRLVNLPGESGVLAYRALASASASGPLTLGWVSTPSLSARMVDRPGTAALLQALRLVGAVQREPITFVAARPAGLVSVNDLVDRPAGTPPLPLATPPQGSPPHLAALRLQALVQRPMTILAFPSAAAARQAALSQNVAAACLGLADVLEPLRAGTLAGLGLAARSRAEVLPNLPTLRDSGLALSAVILRGLAVPAWTDAAAEAELQLALRAVIADPEYTDQALTAGFIPALADAVSWTAQMATERAALERLWATTPWDTTGTG